MTMRTGPHIGCDPVSYFSGTYMTPWCWTSGDNVTRGNQSSNTWSFVSVAAWGEPVGWMSDLYLEQNGANRHC
ncbi:hypothetical protein OHA21_05500 [Actinoplanes sp. NBC_00393]|uniref:hypothetical protein n=1 Tax=Actinoplanes sp. NBC_00393 TaxID=2975953 RepID=UPI002E22AB9B